MFRVTLPYLIFLVKPRNFSQKKKKKKKKNRWYWDKICLTFRQGGLSKQRKPRSNCSKRSSLIRFSLFAIWSVLLETSKNNQTDLVKFYANYVQSRNIFGNDGIILHKTRKTPIGIMDGFFKKVNEKVNLGREKVRVVSLACDTPTGPPLHSYQIWKQSTEE